MSSLEVTYEYPNIESQRRLLSLVGIDELRQRLQKGLTMILSPHSLAEWSQKFHGKSLAALEAIAKRPALFILSGDVGVGKTALAESIGDAVARDEKLNVWLYRMSLASRGSGLVGEMTTLVTKAFADVAIAAAKQKPTKGKSQGGCILLIDEADALVQSRETNQMHHEDRAGVNAVIRGIDDISGKGLPMAVIMCTNRLSSIDPAIQRRAADIILFKRPGDAQRRKLFADAFADVGFEAAQIDKLVAATGAQADGTAYTYSDVSQRIIPRIIIEAYPLKAVTFDDALQVVKAVRPTPSFKDLASD
jgi:SpoVK/Ycf46/Vps4 family AAA+-type ATPase